MPIDNPGKSTLALAAALAAGQLAILGPLAVWSENRDSFAGLSGAALLTFLAAFVALTTLCLLPGLLAPRLAGSLTAALCALTLLMWGQSFLSGRLLTGAAIADAASRIQQVGEVLLWLAALGTAIALARPLAKLLLRSALLVVVVQILALAWGSFGAEPQIGGSGSPRERHWQELTTLSQGRNIIVLVLDSMHRDYVTQALSDNPELASAFSGFRVFTDHLATFPTTRFSVPAMLGGVNYDNTQPAAPFIDSVLSGPDSAPRRLREAGWNVGIATTIGAALSAPADTRLSVDAYVRRKNFARSLGLELLDLSAFRHAPATLGNWVYNFDRWRLRQLVDSSRRNYHAIRSLDFVDDYAQSVAATATEPVFRFLHVGGAHAPVVVDSQCRFIGVQELRSEGYSEQVVCALRQALLLVERLRQMEILDKTFLIVASDHGVSLEAEEAGSVVHADLWSQVLDSSAAALMVKDFDSREPIDFDPAPTSILDLPAIIAQAAKDDAIGADYLPGAVEPERRRAFFYHQWNNGDWSKPYLTALHGFQVSAGSTQRSAWIYTGTAVSPEFSAKEQSRLLADADAYFNQLPPPEIQRRQAD